MHRIARLGAADVGEPGAGDQAMRRVRMVERRQQTALGQQARELLRPLGRGVGRELREPLAAGDRASRQLVDARDPAQRLDHLPVIADPADPALAGRRHELHQTHRVPPPSTDAGPRP